ncbi:MAG: hypothetical protein OXC05_05875 [Halieaceae bacterium]|nr:hypothetical protein [Halieaceae bacterium]
METTGTDCAGDAGNFLGGHQPGEPADSEMNTFVQLSEQGQFS